MDTETDNSESPVTDSIQSRDYQIELFEMAKKQNLLVCMPTGSGKTWVSVLLTKYYLPTCIETTKKVIFLANTVQLVVQQYQYFVDNIPSTSDKSHVSFFVGYMDCDNWTGEKWQDMLSQSEVLVMSTEIFLNILNIHCNLSDVCLIIFDECHHADKNHSMNRIMDIYKEYPKERISELPRILGLTATIIKGIPNSKIQDEIVRMETTLAARAVTYHQYEKILKFSTKAKLLEMFYNGDYVNIRQEFSDYMTLSMEALLALNVENDEEQNPEVLDVRFKHNVPNSKLFGRSKSLPKVLYNYLVILEKICKELGPHCADLGAAVLTISVSRKLMTVAKGTNKCTFYQIFRTMMYQFMSIYPRPSIHDISPKLKLLVEELRKRRPMEGREDMCGIIFVQRKLDCQAIHHYLQECIAHYSDLKFLKTQFITGVEKDFENPLEVEESNNRLIRHIISQFRKKKYNLLISTAVLEEGLDIPSCNLVIRFDNVDSYRSYTQSMGRARNETADFLVFVDATDSARQVALHQKYRQTSVELSEALASNALHLGDESVEIVPRIPELPPFCPGGTPESPRITANDAIQVIHKYCMGTLGPSTGAWHNPVSWFEGELLNYRAFLVLPRNKRSKLHGKIEGEFMTTKESAKRAVFLKACKKLYEAGAFDEMLKPICLDKIEPKILEFFEEEDHNDENLSTQLKGWTSKTYPKSLSKNICPDEPAYMYAIELSLISPQGLEKEKVFDYSNRRYTTGIMSSTSLQMIPVFKLESSMGALRVELKDVTSTCRIEKSEIELSRIYKFQRHLFAGVLKLNLKCTEQGNKSPLLIVPLRINKTLAVGLNYCIDWDIISSLDKEFETASPGEKYEKFVSETARQVPDEKNPHWYSGDAVVVPWHGSRQEFYCVLEVLKDMTPLSPFDNLKIAATFEDYYKLKYNVNIVNRNQALLRCYTLSSILNYLQVKTNEKSNVFRKIGSSSVITLVPELNRLFPYPASLYSQAKTIPSILHRISRFLIAMELGRRISGTTGILQRPTYKVSDNWAYNEAVEMLSMNSESGSSNNGVEAVYKTLENFTQSEKLIPNPTITGSNSSLDSMEPLWDVDIPLLFRLKYIHPHQVTVEQLQAAVAERFPSRGQISLMSGYESQMSKGMGKYRLNLNNTDGLESLDKDTGIDTKSQPPIYELLEAITLAKAQDRISLERLEIIGDSYLKFTTTLFLFGNFPDYDEGKLTELRCKLVSNNQLRRLGKKKNLGEILSGGIFYPEFTFLPPSFNVYETAAQVAMEVGGSMNIFNYLDELKLKGMSFEELKKVVDPARSEKSAPTRALFGYSKLKEKDIADCVEALIGAYYTTGGQKGALALMKWLEIRGPDVNGNPISYGDWTMPPRRKIDNHYVKLTSFLPYLKELEEFLNYTFDDPWLAVEAFTHPDYYPNEITDSFQRLEFLGDAVLDFLITNHIYKNSDAKTPGEVTDLRSALVNNVTFGSLVVRYGLHKQFLYISRDVAKSIAAFVNRQELQNHEVTGQFKLLNEKECPTALDIEVPKVLGDIFESLCGAIYLDSKMSLDTTWRVFYRLMQAEIEKFTKNCPKAPIREIMEMGLKPEIFTDTRSKSFLCVIRFNGKEYRGYGTSKRSAMNAVAKFVLRIMNQESVESP